MKKVILLAFFMTLLNYSVSAQITWTQKAGFPFNTTEARAFAIGNYGYVGGPIADLWRYDPINDVWTQMAAFIGGVRSSPVAFSIGNKGYLGTGGALNDFYEYDPAANSWTSKANFGGSGREGALGISINDKGYIGTGGNYLNDWWEYDTTANAWTQKASLAGPGRYHGGAFSINGKGYISTGFNGSFFNDLWEYDPSGNTWTAKASMPGITRDRPVGLATATKGYIITGWTGTAPLNDAWEYDPVTDAWTSLPIMPTAGRYNACGFMVNNKLYVGTGVVTGGGGDWWELGPDCFAQATAQSTSCPGVCDGVADITFPAPAVVASYVWSTGASTATITNLCAGIYTATVTDTSGCESNVIVAIVEDSAIAILPDIIQPTCFGDTDGSLCALTSSQVTYLWAGGDTASCLQNIPAGTYTVTVTDTSGCSGTASLVLTQPGLLNINFNFANATCATCPNGSSAAQIFGGTAPFSILWETGATLAFINNLFPGIYTCCITDANGCITCDSIEISYPSALPEPGEMKVNISPNPFRDELKIELNPAMVHDNSLRIYDISGREMWTNILSKENYFIINTREFPQGIYFIELSGTVGTRTFKLLKE